MVKTNKKSLLLTMLVVLFSAMLLVGGLAIAGNKPQVDSKVSAEGTSATLLERTGNWDTGWLAELGYSIAGNLIITTDSSKIPNDYVKEVDVSAEKNGSLIAYIINSDVSYKYNCIIYGNVDTICAPENSQYLFYCYHTSMHSITTITFENFDTSNVTNMRSMFSYTEVLTELDLRRFDTRKVEDMTAMFNLSLALTKLDISSFVINSNTLTENMFGENMNSLEFLYAPAECNQTIALPKIMYFEGTDTAVTALSSATNGKVLCSTPNTYAPVRESLDAEVPATGFDMNEIVLTTTLGVTLLVAIAVVFGKTKKSIKR